MDDSRGLERLVFFTDAVVAIAITLLILPLVDRVPEAAAKGTVEEFFVDVWPQLLAFGISFVVIARLWLSHHGMFQHVKAASNVLIGESLVWAFTIVVLPLPTSLVSEFDTSPLTTGLYIGTMFVSSVSLTAMSFTMSRSPEIALESNPYPRGREIGGLVLTSLFFVAFVVGTLVPAINLKALFILVLSWPINSLLRARISGWKTPRHTAKS